MKSIDRCSAKQRLSARVAALVFCCCLGGCSLFEEAPRPAPPDPTGVTGTRNAEAEQLFAKARVLWGRDEVCSQPEKALEYLDVAIEREPGYAEAYMRRAMAENQLGYFDDAFDDATKAIRLNPTAENYAFRGFVLLMQDNVSGAVADLDKAISLDDSHYRPWKFRGAAYLRLNKTEAACADLAKACAKGDCLGLEAARKEAICK